jgi:XTP/dITP diphosphohydrolase
MKDQATMIQLLFATNNQHKIREIQTIVGDRVKITSLKDVGINKDIPEPYDTLEENAREKSKTIYALTGTSCFSEDTGLEVFSLNGAPGVRSARYSGTGLADDNVTMLLSNLRDKLDRKARFRTIISLIWKGTEHIFEGICNGSITAEKRGSGGFGYDPVFVPEGSDKTFAQMTIEEKNTFSHRQKAVEQLVVFLQHQS